MLWHNTTTLPLDDLGNFPISVRLSSPLTHTSARAPTPSLHIGFSFFLVTLVVFLPVGLLWSSYLVRSSFVPPQRLNAPQAAYPFLPPPPLLRYD